MADPEFMPSPRPLNDFDLAQYQPETDRPDSVQAGDRDVGQWTGLQADWPPNPGMGMDVDLPTGHEKLFNPPFQQDATAPMVDSNITPDVPSIFGAGNTDQPHELTQAGVPPQDAHYPHHAVGDDKEGLSLVVNEEPTINEPTINEPTDNEPADNEPTDNEPTDNEPTDNEPTDNEPTDNEPTGNELTTVGEQSHGIDSPTQMLEPTESMDEVPNTYKYELRPSAREVKGGTLTWMDDDKTGDYDPVVERKQRRPLLRKKQGLAVANSGKADSAEERRPCRGFLPIEEDELMVRLLLKGEESRRKFAEYISELAAKEQQELDGREERRYRLRARRSNEVSLLRDSHTVQLGIDHDLSDNLTGQPVARGCYQCAILDLRCPLLDKEFDWPCETCVQDDHDCVLVTPPVRKLPCSSCVTAAKRNKSLVCSYVHDEDQSGPCKQCQAAGTKCFAGPDPAHIRQRIYYADNGEPRLNARPKAKIVRTKKSERLCEDDPDDASSERGIREVAHEAGDTAAESSKPICEYLPLHSDLPASELNQQPKALDGSPERQASTQQAPDQQPTDSTIQDQHPKAPQKPDPKEGDTEKDGAEKVDPRRDDTTKDDAERAGVKRDDLKPTTPASSLPDPTKDPTPQSVDKRMTIRTKFCHPMVFDHRPSPDQRCHFCSIAPYAVLGLGERTVEVVEREDGSGLDELGGGHAADAVEATHVCRACTAQRLRIVSCRLHDLRLIPGNAAESVELAAALTDSIAGRGVDRWCSLCCSLAQYGCQTPAVGDRVGAASAGAGGRGCGLCLCWACALTLGRSHHGDLQGLLRDMETGYSETRPLGLRADWELLKRDGLLLKYVRWSRRG